MPCATVTSLLNRTPFTATAVSNFRDGDEVIFVTGSFGPINGNILTGKVIVRPDLSSQPGTVNVQVTTLGCGLDHYVARNVPETEIELIMHAQGAIKKKATR